MIVYMRLLWVVSLSLVWAQGSMDCVLALLLVNTVVVLVAVRPPWRHVLPLPMLAAALVAMVACMHYLLGDGARDAPESLQVGLLAGAKGMTLVLGLPLLTTGILSDDLLLACARLPALRVSRTGVTVAGQPSGVAYVAASLAMPLVTAPQRLGRVWRAQMYRGVLPSGLLPRVLMAWRRPWFAIWDLHIEPLLKMSLGDLPTLFDALAMKGYRVRRWPKWSRCGWDWQAGLFLVISVGNVLQLFL